MPAGRCGAPRSRSGGASHGEADLSLENAPVRGLKAIDALGVNRERFQEWAGDPVVLTAGVDHDAGELPPFGGRGQVGYLDGRSEDPHFINHGALGSAFRKHAVLLVIKSQTRNRIAASAGSQGGSVSLPAYNMRRFSACVTGTL